MGAAGAGGRGSGGSARPGRLTFPGPPSAPRGWAMDARWWAVVVLATLPSLGAGGESPEAPPQSWTQSWLFRFLLNVAGYASFMVPGYLSVQYLRRKNYSETGRGLCFPSVKACVFGNEPKAPDEVLSAPRTETAESTPSWQVSKSVFCASGLQDTAQS